MLLLRMLLVTIDSFDVMRLWMSWQVKNAGRKWKWDGVSGARNIDVPSLWNSAMDIFFSFVSTVNYHLTSPRRLIQVLRYHPLMKSSTNYVRTNICSMPLVPPAFIPGKGQLQSFLFALQRTR